MQKTQTSSKYHWRHGQIKINIGTRMINNNLKIIKYAKKGAKSQNYKIFCFITVNKRKNQCPKTRNQIR